MQLNGRQSAIHYVLIRFKPLAPTYAFEPRFDYGADPVRGWVKTERHELLGIVAPQIQERFASHNQCPEQQPFDVRSEEVEGRLVAGVRFQETPYN